MPNYDNIPLPVRRRYDPERLETVVRSVSGRTKCPDCDTWNPAGQKFCDRCGTALYPEWDPDPTKSEQHFDLFDLLFDPDEHISHESQSSQENDYVSGYPPVKMPDSVVTACPRCRTQNPEGNNYCGKCGTRLVPDIPQYAESGEKKDDKSRDTDKPAYYK